MLEKGDRLLGKKWIGITVAGLVLTSAAVGGYSLWKSNGSIASLSTIPVSVAAATTGSLTKGQMFSGVTDSEQKVPLAPAVPAKITNIYVKVGDKVSKGQPLFRVDPADLQETINKAKAGVDASRVALAQVLAQQDQLNQQAKQAGQAQSQAQYDAQMKARADAQARYQANAQAQQKAADNLEQAQKNYDDARNRYQTMQTMYQNGSVPKSYVDETEQEMKNAEAALKTAQDEYNRLKAEGAKITIPPAPAPVGSSSSSIHLPAVDMAQQQVAQAENAYQMVRNNLSNPVISAPISGTVDAIDGEVGKVASNKAPFMVLGNVEGLRVVMNVPESVMNQFQNNQTVDVFYPSPAIRVSGSIQSIGAVDPKTKTSMITITVPTTQGVKSGMVAQINVLPSDAKRGIVLPLTAIVKEKEKSFVYVASGDKALKKYVTLIASDPENVMVSGLTEGEKIIIKGLSLMSENAKISIK